VNGAVYPTSFEVRVNGPLEVCAVFTPDGCVPGPQDIRIGVPLGQEARKKLLEILREWNRPIFPVFENKP
jgi:hypothetical protein